MKSKGKGKPFKGSTFSKARRTKEPRINKRTDRNNRKPMRPKQHERRPRKDAFKRHQSKPDLMKPMAPKLTHK